MKKTWTKWISLTVIAGLLSAYAPLPAAAADSATDVQPPSVSKVTDPHAKDILFEDVKKREENVKHFLLKDKTYEAVEYAVPVHYKVNGSWKDIDNTLVEGVDTTNQKVVENKANNWRVQFAKTTKNKNLVQIKEAGNNITFGLDGAQDTSVITSQQVPKGYDTFSEKQKRETLVSLTSTATYPAILPNVDLQYVVTPTGVKENLILQAKEAPTAFSFTIKAPQMVVTLQDGKLRFADKKNPEQIVYETEAPYMVDANGEQSMAVQSALEANGNGYTLTIQPDAAWVNDAARAFPVTIDPTITVTNAPSVTDSFVSATNPNSNYGSSVLLRVGKSSVSGTTRSFLRFDVPVLGSDSFVTDANVWLYAYSTTNTTSQVNLYRVTSDWNESTITWNNQPTYDANRVMDYAQVLNQSESINTWNITELAQKWMTEGQNYGLMLRANSEASGFSDFFSVNASSTYASDRPFAIFSYIDASGLEDYWTYHSVDVGRAGTASVNDVSGNLVFTHPDTSTTGARMPVSVNHVYNSTDAKDAGIGYGTGWRLNYSQKIIPTSVASTYIYIDEDGTTHYFNQSAQIINGVVNTNYYPDESGLNINMSINSASTTERYVVKDKSDSQLSFNASGDLTFIRDANGNTQTLTYTSSKLTSIKDGSNRQTTLTYDANGNLYQVKDPANRATTYGYTSGNLTSITYPDGEVSQYIYDSGNYMTESKNIDGYYYDYTYTSIAPKRVNTVTEFGTSDTGAPVRGQKLGINFGTYKTVFTTYELDTNQQDKVKNVETYMYDQDGHTTNVRDDQGNGSFTEYSSAAGATKNKLTASSKLQRVSTNILLNHNFENTDAWVSASENGDTGFDGYTSNSANLGSKSYYMVKTNALGAHVLKQSVTVEPNKTYTLSGYISTSSISAGTDVGARMAVRYTNGSNATVTVKSDPISGNHGFERSDFSFTTPAILGSTTATVVLEIEGTSGNANFDNVQFEVGDTPSRYNLVENADMTTTTTLANGATFPIYYGQTSGSASSNVYTSKLGGPPQLDNKTVGIAGVATERRNVYTDINVSGQAGDKYTYGAWAIGDSVPQGNGRYFALWLAFFNTDGTISYVTNSYNDEVYDWQYLAASAVADKPYTKVRIYGIYYLNQNNAWFDGFQLYKEPFESTYDYDSNGNLISSHELDGSSDQTAYNATNDATSYTDANGKTSTAEYNSTHQATKVTSENDVISQNTFDTSNGNLLSDIVTGTEGKSIKSSLMYTADGNYIATVTDSKGNATTNTYANGTGMLTKVLDANGNSLSKEYDPNTDNLLAVSKSVDYQLMKNTYSYSKDQLKSIIQNGTNVSFEYSVFGDNTSISIGGNPIVRNTYQDYSHLLKNTQFANGNQVELDYDKFDRLTKKTLNDSGSSSFSYFYDNDGNVSKISDSVTGQYSRMDYDSSGQLTRSYDQSKNQINYGYNILGQLASHTFKTSSQSFSETFAYTDLGAPRSVIAGGFTTTYSYDSLDRQTGKSMQLLSPYQVGISYLDGNAPNSTTPFIGTYKNGNELSYDYDYDKLGNITKITTNKWKWNGTSWAIDTKYQSDYAYNELSELVRENDQLNNQTVLYSYDVGGNIRSKKRYSYTLGTPTDLLKAWTYNYDNATWHDLLTSVTTTAYSGGTSTSSTDLINYSNGATGKETGLPNKLGDTTLTWTWGNQLKSVDNTNWHVDYTYNDAGIRTSKTVLNKTSGVTTASTYVLDGGNVVYETVGSTKLHYSYNSNGDLVSINFNGSEYYYIFNAQGDVVGLVDKFGNQVVSYTYDAFGNAISISGTESGQNQVGGMNPYRYKGYRYDSDTKWYYLQSRYYSPELSRFISADNEENNIDSSEDLLGFNLFAYCSNNPELKADPSGKFANIIIGAVLGAAISGIGKIVTNKISGKAWNDGIWTAVAAGAISGGLAATGVGLIGQIAGNAAIGMAGSAADQIGAHKTIRGLDYTSIGIEGGIGAVSGWIGGEGVGGNELRASLKSLKNDTIKALRRRNIKYSKKLIGKYSAKKQEIHKTIGVAIGRYTLATVFAYGSPRRDLYGRVH